MDRGRCILCGERGWQPTARRLRYANGRERRFPLACRSCGLLVETAAGSEDARDLKQSMQIGPFESPEGARFGFDIFTLRIAAGAAGVRAVPDGPEQAEALRHPHSRLAGRARLTALSAAGRQEVALGVICRPTEVEGVIERLRPHAAWASEAVILTSGPEAPPRSLERFGRPPMRLASRPLGADFAAQRNALQALSSAPWMLQLDADETLSVETGALLPALAASAATGGTVSVGLPRRNLVDGVLSDVYPDVQYRLNRRYVRYRGEVHERPERPWQQSTIALHGAIEHHLTREHVLSRSARYEALSPGRGRTEETDALLRPYRP